MVWSAAPEIELPRGMTTSPEMNSVSSSSYHNLSNKGAPSLISHYEAAFSSAYRGSPSITSNFINNNNNNNASPPPPLSSPPYLRGDVQSRYGSSGGTPPTPGAALEQQQFHSIGSPDNHNSPVGTVANSPGSIDPIAYSSSNYDASSVQSYLGNTTCMAPPSTTMSFYNSAASSMLSNPPQHLSPAADYSQFGYTSPPSCGNYFYSSGYPPIGSGYNTYPGMTNSGPLAGN